MDRRTFLGSCGVVATMGVAGCGGTGEPANEAEPANQDDGSTPSGDSEAEPSIASDSNSISTTSTDCGEPDGSATVTFDEEKLQATIEGTMSVSNPCHEARIGTATYDAESGAATVTIGAKSTEEMCEQCLGKVEYTATVAFEGALPGKVVVEHGKSDPKTVAEATAE